MIANEIKTKELVYFEKVIEKTVRDRTQKETIFFSLYVDAVVNKPMTTSDIMDIRSWNKKYNAFCRIANYTDKISLLRKDGYNIEHHNGEYRLVI